MYFYYLPYIILPKGLRWFDEKNVIFLHDFYVMRPLFWVSAIAQEATKVLQGGVSIPFTGSLRAKGVHFKDHNKNPFAYCLHKLGPIRTSDKSVLIRHND